MTQEKLTKNEKGKFMAAINKYPEPTEPGPEKNKPKRHEEIDRHSEISLIIGHPDGPPLINKFLL